MKIADDFAAIAAGVKKLHEPGTRKAEPTVTLTVNAIDPVTLSKLLGNRVAVRNLMRTLEPVAAATAYASQSVAKIEIVEGQNAPKELFRLRAGESVLPKLIADEMRAFFGCDGE